MMNGWNGKRLLANGKMNGAFLPLWLGLRVGGRMRRNYEPVQRALDLNRWEPNENTKFL
jgi:hypothetical protein